MQPVAWAFAACCLVNFLDVLGIQGTTPVLVPYGRSLGASLEEIASFNTLRFGFGMISMIWMSRLADKRGTKFVLLISIVGSMTAYLAQGLSWTWSQCPSSEVVVGGNGTLGVSGAFEARRWRGCEELAQTGGSGTWLVKAGELQPGTWQGRLICEADCGARDGVLVMQLGRAVAGFFGGTMPVLRSWITQVSVHDSGLMKRRIIILQSAALMAPFTVAPVAGALALMGLYLPWLVSSGISLMVLGFTTAFFKNASQQNSAGGAAPRRLAEARATQGSLREPTADPVLHLIALIYCMGMCGLSSVNILLPVTLEEPVFGFVDPASDARTRANVASAAGIVGMPQGLLSLLSSTVLYLLLSSRIGDQNTVRIAMILVPPSLIVAAFAAKVWVLSLTLGLLGVGMGLLVPAIAPLLSSYVARAHPSKMAQATAIPLLGLQLGFMLGAQLTALIVEHWGLRMAWLSSTVIFTLPLVLLSEVACRVAAPAKPSVTLSRRQSTLAEETQAQPVEKFVELVCGEVRAMLMPETAESKNLPVWNGLAQGAMRRTLREALPSMRRWDEGSDGVEHLQDVAAWLLSVGTQDERREFREMFPAVCGEDWNLCVNAMGDFGAFNVELQRENSKHSGFSKTSKQASPRAAPRALKEPATALGHCESV